MKLPLLISMLADDADIKGPFTLMSDILLAINVLAL